MSVLPLLHVGPRHQLLLPHSMAMEASCTAVARARRRRELCQAGGRPAGAHGAARALLRPSPLSPRVAPPRPLRTLTSAVAGTLCAT